MKLIIVLGLSIFLFACSDGVVNDPNNEVDAGQPSEDVEDVPDVKEVEDAPTVEDTEEDTGEDVPEVEDVEPVPDVEQPVPDVRTWTGCSVGNVGERNFCDGASPERCCECWADGYWKWTREDGELLSPSHDRYYCQLNPNRPNWCDPDEMWPYCCEDGWLVEEDGKPFIKCTNI